MAIVIKFLCRPLSDLFLLSIFPGIFHLTIPSLRECLQNQLLRKIYSSQLGTLLLLWWIILAGNLESEHGVGERKRSSSSLEGWFLRRELRNQHSAFLETCPV